MSSPSKRTGSRRRWHAFFEPLLIGSAIAVTTWAAAQSYYRGEVRASAVFGEDGQAEIASIVARYGSDRFSEQFEEQIVRDYFQDRRDGVFVDVGSNHYSHASNTYYLESQLGWSGIAVDALEEFAADYRTYRPRTQFVTAFVSDVAGATVPFFVPLKNKLVSSAGQGFTEERAGGVIRREVPTTTLNVILDQAGVSRLDFLSMDIELSEPTALAGFDIQRYKPSLACIEAHPEVRQQIIDYFARNGYTIVGKYLRADAKNLYFKPMS